MTTPCKSPTRWRHAPGLLASVLLIAAFTALLAGVSIGNLLFPHPDGGVGSTTPPLRAAIVDPLGASIPNSTFVWEATRILEDAGYAVDVYPGKETTVDFFRKLPTLETGIVVLRAHSSATHATDPGPEGVPVAIFTSEPMSPEHPLDRLAGRLKRGATSWSATSFFAFTPSFVKTSMEGKFPGTTVIVMGCEGFRNPSMAQAFIDRGAGAYVGWGEDVTVGRMDTATVRLLHHAVAEERPLKEAISRAMADVGPDPEYNSRLRAIPSLDNLASFT